MTSLEDSLNFLSKLTPKRLANISQILSSYYYSLYRRSPFSKGMPISISVEPTTSCNLRCPECPSGLRNFTRPTGMLSKELFSKIIDELAPKLSYLLFYFQGEPYLHPSFLEMVQYASSKKIYTATSTNGHYLSEKNAKATIASGLDRLIVSIDGTTQETYESYRIGGKLEKVLEGTQNVVKWRKEMRSKTPYIIFQYLVVKPNEHQIKDVKSLAKKLGVDKVLFKTAQIYDYENGSDLIPVQSKYSRYQKNTDGTYKIKGELLNHCWKMWHSCVITWNGSVVPCCFDKDGAYILGDLTYQSFENVWKSREYNEFRASLLTSRGNVEICSNCTEGTKVWA